MWYLRRGGDDVGSPDGSAAGDEEQGINTSSSFMSDKRAAHRNRSGRWSVFPGLRRLIFGGDVARSRESRAEEDEFVVVYSWQATTSDQKRAMLQRQQELRQVDLAVNEDLLIEWFALIQHLDALVRFEVDKLNTESYRTRSHSLPMPKDTSCDDGAHGGNMNATGSRVRLNVRKPRAGTFQSTGSTPNLYREPSSSATSAGRDGNDAVLQSMEEMREKLKAKDDELRRLKAALKAERVSSTSPRRGNKGPLSVPMLKTRSVTIGRDDNGSFGIQVKAVGVEGQVGSVRIAALKPFQRYRGLEVGDVIFEVDGEYLAESDYKAVTAAIRGCSDLATFVVASPDELPVTAPTSLVELTAHDALPSCHLNATTAEVAVSRQHEVGFSPPGE